MRPKQSDFGKNAWGKENKINHQSRFPMGTIWILSFNIKKRNSLACAKDKKGSYCMPIQAFELYW